MFGEGAGFCNLIVEIYSLPSNLSMGIHYEKVDGDYIQCLAGSRIVSFFYLRRSETLTTAKVLSKETFGEKPIMWKTELARCSPDKCKQGCDHAGLRASGL